LIIFPNQSYSDFNKIVDNIYQGSFPPVGSFVRDAGFDVLVLCAKEYQPDSDKFPGVTVFHCPFDDDPSRHPYSKEIDIIKNTLSNVVPYIKDDKKVLVTCQAGRNRSGLLNAFIIKSMYKSLTNIEIIKLIKDKRQFALTNPKFVEVIKNLK